jgi:heme/copper-type cytochrome/quinol oxidase subunit 3
MTATTPALRSSLPEAQPVRPRMVMVATALAAAATALAFAGMIGLYIAERSDALANDRAWLPEGATIPLLHGTMNMITFAMAAITAHWALYAIGRDDRVRSYLALGITLVLGLATIARSGFYFSQIGVTVRSPFGVLFYGITGMQLAMTVAGLVFLALMAFRTLGGQYSARDREGVAAAVLFWDVTVAVYATVWYAIFITK